MAYGEPTLEEGGRGGAPSRFLGASVEPWILALVGQSFAPRLNYFCRFVRSRSLRAGPESPK